MKQWAGRTNPKIYFNFSLRQDNVYRNSICKQGAIEQRCRQLGCSTLCDMVSMRRVGCNLLCDEQIEPILSRLCVLSERQSDGHGNVQECTDDDNSVMRPRQMINDNLVAGPAAVGSVHHNDRHQQFVLEVCRRCILLRWSVADDCLQFDIFVHSVGWKG